MHKRLSLLLLLALLLAACGAKATPTATPPPVVADDFAVIADGRLRPRQFVQLTFAGTGRIAEVLVAEGDVVAAGQLIARLESS